VAFAHVVLTMVDTDMLTWVRHTHVQLTHIHTRRRGLINVRSLQVKRTAAKYKSLRLRQRQGLI